VLAAIGKLEADTQLLHSHTQSIAKLEFQVEQLVNALNQIEEEKLWSQFEDNSLYYMIDGNASSSSHYEQVQANTTLRTMVDNEVEERKDEHFELPNNPNPYPAPLEMEYESKA
jgi:hypothetical protein